MGSVTAEAAFEITKAPLTVAVSEGQIITKEYDGTDDVEGTVSLEIVGLQNQETATTSGTWKYTSTGVGTGLTIQITGITIDFTGASTADASNYSYTQSDLSTTGAITAKNITIQESKDYAYDVATNHVIFTEPSFDGIREETVTGNLVYTISDTDYDSYDTLIAYLNQQVPDDESSELTVTYKLTANGNYTGTISGELTLTLHNLVFTEGLSTTKTATYGAKWDDILGFDENTYVATVNNQEVTGTYTLTIDGVSYTQTAIPAVKENGATYAWTVTFTSSDDVYKDIEVDSGTVTIENATITSVGNTTQTSVYTGSGISITAPTATTVNSQALTATYNVGTATSYTEVGTYTIGYTLSAPNNDDLTGDITFEITAADSTGEITDNPSDETYVVSSDAIVYGKTYKIEYTPTIAPAVSIQRIMRNVMNFFSLTTDELSFSDEEVVLYYGSTKIANATGIQLGETATLTFTVAKDIFTDVTAFDGTLDEFTIGWGGDSNAKGTSDTIQFNLTKADLTAIVDEADTSATKEYDGDADFTDVALTLTGKLAGDAVSATAAGTRVSANVAGADTFTANTVTSSGDQAGYYNTIKPDAVSGDVTITAKDVTATDDSAFTVVEGAVIFTPPTFDGVGEESVTGRMTSYNYSGTSYSTYDTLIQALNAVTVENNADTITVGYEFKADGNYTGVISGDMTMTVLTLGFSGDIIATTATYGDTWKDILAFSQTTYSAKVGEHVVSGVYTLTIDGVDYDEKSVPDVKPANTTYEWKVTFTATDGTHYQNVLVDTGEVTVEPLVATYTWNATSFIYDGTAKLPTPTITNAVGNDDVTVIASGEQTEVGDLYIAVASLQGADQANYTLPSKGQMPHLRLLL